MAVSGIVGWSLLNGILHGGDTFNVALYWLALVLGVLFLAVFFISTRIWHQRYRCEALEEPEGEHVLTALGSKGLAPAKGIYSADDASSGSPSSQGLA